MGEDAESAGEKNRKSGTIRPGIQALVQCREFRCLAYCDDQGVWHDAQRNEVLPEVLAILEVIKP